MKKSPLIYFFVEGETEDILIKDLKRKYNFTVKNIRIINLWNITERKLKVLLTTLEPKKSNVFIVYDIDRTENIDNFLKNINIITKYSSKTYILQQNNNFEEELAYACNKTKQLIYNCFCAQITSCDNFKNSFIDCRNRLEKLEGLNFNDNKLWDKDRNLLACIESQGSSKLKHFSFEDFKNNFTG
ncbi:hypothetical protein AB6F89_14750 [Providencia hangzhouensis]|uniref:hypothetical protein n=1 Tax=Providencia hangzhouensis TaxID=3031799 RepID=UPI0034DD7ACA